MTLDILHIVLGLIALAAAAAAFVFSQRKPPETAHLSAELSERQREIADLKSERDDLRRRAETAERAQAADAAKMTERDASMARERENLAKMQKESEERFKALADAALLKSQQQFVQIADETLKKHKEGAEGELGKMLKPIHESFGQFQKKVDEIQKMSAEDRAKLEEQIRGVSESVRKTESAAGKLASALSTTRHGGRWGEETLRNVLEMSGLSPYADFTEQTSSDTDKGKIRPDVIIRMPGGRELVIDSKVSLDDYLAASSESDPAKKQQFLASHAAKVRAHVTSLARKDYWKGFSDREYRVCYLAWQRTTVGVTKNDAFASSFSRGAQCFDRITRVAAPAVKEVFGVKENTLTLTDQESDRFSDHREVLLGRDANDLLDVEH